MLKSNSVSPEGHDSSAPCPEFDGSGGFGGVVIGDPPGKLENRLLLSVKGLPPLP